MIGAGFIGSEVAATCQAMGAEVTLLEAYHTPLARVLGDRMGAMCADLHIANGMDLRCGITVDHLESDPGGPDPLTVCLADDAGTRLAADVVVVGIGVVPSVGWLEGSGLSLENGVICDGTLFAGDRVVAAGDEVVVVSGSGAEGKMIALYRSGDGLSGVLAISQPAKLMGYRPLLAAGASFDEALAHAAT